MSCCCDGFGFGAVAEGHFTEQIAARELQQYRVKGPGVTSRLLCDGLTGTGHVTGSLLDIGAGIGALTFELLEAGVTAALTIDASPAFLTAASREAARRGRSSAVQFVHADFLTAAARIPSAAIVTLDRVICCYPAYASLLGEALRHAERYFAFSYPRDLWFVRAVNVVANSKRRLNGNPFRTFIHSAADMEGVITRSGFNLVRRCRTWTWCVDVYVKGEVR